MIRVADWWKGGRFVEIDGHRIFTRVQGDGPTLVFLHGFPTSSHDWADVVADLASDFRCVTFDYLGYGASDKPRGANYSSIAQTERVLTLLARLDVRRAVLVAHDLGGILLQQALRRVHDGDKSLEIEQAIFSNSSVYPKLYRPTRLQTALVRPLLGRVVALTIRRESFETSFPKLFPTHPPSPVRMDDIWAAISKDRGQRLWPKHLVYMAERAAQGDAWLEAMRRTAIPLGFLYGLADPISGAHILAEAERDLPHARCVGLPGLGHFPQVESPADYAAGLRRVLARP